MSFNEPVSDSDTSAASYEPHCPSRSWRGDVRGLTYHVRTWGPEEAPLVFMLHGWRDSSASFQFMVDALQDEWRIVAPDWRGHGQTDWTPGAYWMAEFLCDLDALFDAFAPRQPIALVGHSLGGNIAGVYAGLRPERVGALVMLDALGPPLDRSPLDMPEFLVSLMDSQTGAPKSGRIYRSLDAMAERLVQVDRRLKPAQALFLARANARALPDGGFCWPHDPAFKRSLPSLHSLSEWGDCWRRIQAPALCLTSSDPRPNAAASHPDKLAERAAFFRDLTVRMVPDTSHNLHHDAPAATAQALETFLRGTGVRD